MITATEALPLAALNDLYRKRIQAERRGEPTAEISARIVASPGRSRAACRWSSTS